MCGDSIWGLWKVKSTGQIGEKDRKPSYNKTDSLPFSRSVIFQSEHHAAWLPELGTEDQTEKPRGKPSTSFCLEEQMECRHFCCFALTLSNYIHVPNWQSGGIHETETGVHKTANSLKVELTLASGPGGLTVTRSIASQTKHVSMLQRI